MTTDASDYGIGSKVWPGLAKVVEEQGELAQVLGKIMGSDGRDVYWDGQNLRAMAMEEIADLEASLAFFKSENFSRGERDTIADRKMRKVSKFHYWHAQAQP